MSSVKKVKAFLWNGVWTQDDDDLPLRGVKTKWIPKHRDILPALDNDVLGLIGKAVVAKREEATRAYHQDQRDIVLGKKQMPLNCVEHAAHRLHKEVRYHFSNHLSRRARGPGGLGAAGRAGLKEVCDNGNHPDTYNEKLKALLGRVAMVEVPKMGPEWEWAGKGKGKSCSLCGVRGHTKKTCKGCFRTGTKENFEHPNESWSPQHPRVRPHAHNWGEPGQTIANNRPAGVMGVGKDAGRRVPWMV